MKLAITPNITDIVLLCCLLFFLLDGFRKGFLKCAVGPVIFIGCGIVGVIYFDLTQNFMKAIMFTSIATMVLNIVAWMLFLMGQKSIDPVYRNYSPLLGRFLGGAINLAWQGCILIIVIFLISVAPLHVYGLDKMQRNIQQSYSYYFLSTKGLSELPVIKRTVTSFSIFQDSDQMQQLSSSKEFQAFFSSPKVQTLLQDEKFMKYIQEKNIPQVMSYPGIWDIFRDDELMGNFGRLAEKVYELNLPPKPVRGPNVE